MLHNLPNFRIDVSPSVHLPPAIASLRSHLTPHSRGSLFTLRDESVMSPPHTVNQSYSPWVDPNADEMPSSPIWKHLKREDQCSEHVAWWQGLVPISINHFPLFAASLTTQIQLSHLFDICYTFSMPPSLLSCTSCWRCSGPRCGFRNHTRADNLH
uniref:Uncharacterized protein n=1 Tax=Mesocestoides corti TaxID=53468 RepID=A0A5K3G4H8_MESCO